MVILFECALNSRLHHLFAYAKSALMSIFWAIKKELVALKHLPVSLLQSAKALGAERNVQYNTHNLLNFQEDLNTL